MQGKKMKNKQEIKIEVEFGPYLANVLNKIMLDSSKLTALDKIKEIIVKVVKNKINDN